MKLIDLKRALVGTALGRKIVRHRELRHLAKSVRRNPETGGTICQELCTRLLLPRLCGQDAAFVDVGAHIGSVIAEVRDYSRSIRITAIEADPTKAAALQRKFPEIELHNCAVGESEGDVSFFVDLERPGYSSLARGGKENRAVQEITVTLRRLDDVAAGLAGVDVIKIDVEGFELGVLRGGEDLVSRCRPAIVFESGLQEGDALDYTVEGLFDWLSERDYEVFVPNRVAHDGPPLGRQGFVEAHAYPRRTLDYFAIPAERRTTFRDRARRALGVVVPQ